VSSYRDLVSPEKCCFSGNPVIFDGLSICYFCFLEIISSGDASAKHFIAEDVLSEISNFYLDCTSELTTVRPSSSPEHREEASINPQSFLFFRCCRAGPLIVFFPTATHLSLPPSSGGVGSCDYLPTVQIDFRSFFQCAFDLRCSGWEPFRDPLSRRLGRVSDQRPVFVEISATLSIHPAVTCRTLPSPPASALSHPFWDLFRRIFGEGD